MESSLAGLSAPLGAVLRPSEGTTPPLSPCSARVGRGGPQEVAAQDPHREGPGRFAQSREPLTERGSPLTTSPSLCHIKNTLDSKQGHLVFHRVLSHLLQSFYVGPGYPYLENEMQCKYQPQRNYCKINKTRILKYGEAASSGNRPLLPFMRFTGNVCEPRASRDQARPVLRLYLSLSLRWAAKLFKEEKGHSRVMCICLRTVETPTDSNFKTGGGREQVLTAWMLKKK